MDFSGAMGSIIKWLPYREGVACSQNNSHSGCSGSESNTEKEKLAVLKISEFVASYLEVYISLYETAWGFKITGRRFSLHSATLTGAFSGDMEHSLLYHCSQDVELPLMRGVAIPHIIIILQTSKGLFSANGCLKGHEFCSSTTSFSFILLLDSTLGLLEEKCSL